MEVQHNNAIMQVVGNTVLKTYKELEIRKRRVWRQGHSCRELLEDASDVDIIQPAQRNPCAFGRVLLDQVKGIHKHAKIPYGSHSL
jgi:hypothetical protein